MNLAKLWILCALYPLVGQQRVGPELPSLSAGLFQIYSRIRQSLIDFAMFVPAYRSELLLAFNYLNMVITS